MNKGIGVACLAVGIALIVYGAHSTDSTASHVSNFFTGSPTNKALWMLLGGIAASIVGAVMVFLPARKV